MDVVDTWRTIVGVVNDIIITSYIYSLYSMYYILYMYARTLLLLRGVILVGGGGGALLSGDRWSEWN